MDNPKVLKNTRVITKCLFLNDHGQALVLKRGAEDNHRGHKWDLPGGGYERGENLAESAKREVLEESGLLLKQFQPLFIDNRIGEKLGFYSGDHVFAFCLLATECEGELTISDEHIEYRWVTPQDALELDYGNDGGFFSSSIRAYLNLQGPTL